MAEENNIEAQEQAADISWQMACADVRVFARGIPLADLLEEDDNG